VVKKKAVCPICKRKLRTNNFVFNKKIKLKVCRRCDKRIGNNMFYIPSEKKGNKIGKWSISEEEKKKLLGKYLGMGYDFKSAWRMIYSRLRGLKKVKKQVREQRKREKIKEKYKELKAKEQRKKLIEGLWKKN